MQHGDEADEAAAARRRRARAQWRIRVVPLGEGEAEPMHGPVAERIAATVELTRQAWALSGRPLPDYARDAMPCRLRRLRDLLQEDDE